MGDFAKIVLVAVLVSLALIIGPFVTIWSLNVLFPVLAIPFNFETWLSVILLSAVIRSNITFKK
jgi:hypothetical protein